MKTQALILGMYLRITKRHNRDGSTVTDDALAETVWNAAAKRADAKVIHRFGRADQLDHDALKRLVCSISRVLDAEEAPQTAGATLIDAKAEPTLPEIEIDRVYDLGIVLAARSLWEQLGIGDAVRSCLAKAGLSAPHEAAVLARLPQFAWPKRIKWLI